MNRFLIKLALFLVFVFGTYFFVNRYVLANQTQMQAEIALRQFDSKESAQKNREMQEVYNANWAYPILALFIAICAGGIFLPDVKKCVDICLSDSPKS